MTDGSTSTLIADLLSRCTFPVSGTAVSCAISGGPDSLALLLLAHAHGLRVTAIHVDHGLRDNSADDVNVIRPITEQLGIELRVHTLSIEDGPNLEARARDARYAVMPTDVMTGHTADDQAETLLINLLRGAAGQGLGAMRPGFMRPILALRREETHALCSAAGLMPVNDHTNDDSRFLRNRVRAELLPLMADISRRDPTPLLARTADVLRADNDLLDELARDIDPTDALALAAAPAPLARRAIRQWLSNPYPPDLATIERVLSVARGDALACDIGENREIRRSKQRLSLRNLG
jgi:tRNA(Ile)-lysidine synthase